jgi:hypothetical protein
MLNLSRSAGRLKRNCHPERSEGSAFNDPEYLLEAVLGWLQEWRPTCHLSMRRMNQRNARTDRLVKQRSALSSQHSAGSRELAHPQVRF